MYFRCRNDDSGVATWTRASLRHSRVDMLLYAAVVPHADPIGCRLTLFPGVVRLLLLRALLVTATCGQGPRRGVEGPALMDLKHRLLDIVDVLAIPVLPRCLRRSLPAITVCATPRRCSLHFVRTRTRRFNIVANVAP